MLTAAVLYERGLQQSNAGRHSTARTTLDEALRRSGDADLSARIVGTIAYLESEMGDPGRGVESCRAALEAKGLSTHTRAILRSQIGLIELRRGNADAALPFLTSAIRSLGSDPARLGRVHLNRGLARLERREVVSAGRDFDSAAEAFERSGEPIELAKARNNQGYAAMLAGDLVAALALMDESRPMLSELSPVALATCDADRAEVLLSAGMPTEAAELLESVAHIYGARGLRQAQAEAEFALARSLVFADLDRSAAIARRAARRFRARGSETWALRADGFALTAAVLSGRRGPRLAADLDRTARLLATRHDGRDAASLRLQRARLDLRTGRPEDARRALARVHLGQDAPISVRLLAREVRAEVDVATGRRTSALTTARLGLDELADWQSTFGSLDLQSSLALHGTRLVLSGITAAVATGRPEVVLEWSERTRSIASRVVPVRPPANPRSAAALSELRQWRAADPDATPTAEELALRASLRARQWRDRGSGAVDAPASLDEIRQELGRAESALLSILWSGSTLTAVVVSPTAATVVDLGDFAPVKAALDGLLADLDMSAAVLSPAMQVVVQASLDSRLARLDELLVAPLAPLLDARRLVITPPGALAGLPWSMLPSLAGVPVTMPESATRWRATRQTLLQIERAGFVAGPGVERAEDEVREAASSWSRAEVLAGADATCGAVAAMASRVDLLHLSAHGRHSADNPLFSGVELVDGPWFGYDIDQVPRIPSVVILSACELGRSAVRWGQEVLGMSQAWLHAGARCVIASPASVNDELARELLAGVHARMAGGAAPGIALVDAGATAGRRTDFQCYGVGW